MAGGAIDALRTGPAHVRGCDAPAAAVKDNSTERLPRGVTSSTGQTWAQILSARALASRARSVSSWQWVRREKP